MVEPGKSQTAPRLRPAFGRAYAADLQALGFVRKGNVANRRRKEVVHVLAARSGPGSSSVCGRFICLAEVFMPQIAAIQYPEMVLSDFVTEGYSPSLQVSSAEITTGTDEWGGWQVMPDTAEELRQQVHTALIEARRALFGPDRAGVRLHHHPWRSSPHRQPGPGATSSVASCPSDPWSGPRQLAETPGSDERGPRSTRFLPSEPSGSEPVDRDSVLLAAQGLRPSRSHAQILPSGMSRAAAGSRATCGDHSPSRLLISGCSTRSENVHFKRFPTHGR